MSTHIRMGASASHAAAPSVYGASSESVIDGARNMLRKFGSSPFVKAVAGLTDRAGRPAVFARVQDSPVRYMFIPAAEYDGGAALPLNATWVASTQVFTTAADVMAEVCGEESFAIMMGIALPLQGITLRKVLLRQNVDLEGWFRSSSDFPFRMAKDTVVKRIASQSQVYVLQLPDGTCRIVLRVSKNCADMLDRSQTPLRGLRSVCV